MGHQPLRAQFMLSAVLASYVHCIHWNGLRFWFLQFSVVGRSEGGGMGEGDCWSTTRAELSPTMGVYGGCTVWRRLTDFHNLYTGAVSRLMRFSNRALARHGLQLEILSVILSVNKIGLQPPRFLVLNSINAPILPSHLADPGCSGHFRNFDPYSVHHRAFPSPRRSTQR